MKAIGIIVLLFVIGLGVVTFMVTKEPDRTLDAQGQTWVDEYDVMARHRREAGEHGRAQHVVRDAGEERPPAGAAPQLRPAPRADRRAARSPEGREGSSAAGLWRGRRSRSRRTRSSAGPRTRRCGSTWRRSRTSSAALSATSSWRSTAPSSAHTPTCCDNAPMATLPSGTVTFVFTDIEGSTALLKRLGERYPELLAAHRQIVRDVFELHGGVEIDTQGDAFFFAFARARDAVAAAAEVQKEHAKHPWPGGETVRVRMGLHTGEPAVGEEGYHGVDVVRAARLSATGKGGQVLLSETTRALLGSALPDGVSVHAVGERHLKDMDEPERVYELAIDGVEAPDEDAPAPRAPERGLSRPASSSAWTS